MMLIVSQAKARKLNLWRGHTPKAAQDTSSFDAIVLKIVNGDTIEVGPKQESGRRTIQFSSIRQPK
jgi:endonuclease YncB( thermonuclease family)